MRGWPMSPSEERHKIISTNWNLDFEHKTGKGFEITLLSGADSLKQLINYLEYGFRNGGIELSQWRVMIYRGQQYLIVSKNEDLNPQLFKAKWPDFNSHNSTQLLPLSPRSFVRENKKKKYIKQDIGVEISRGMNGCSQELESIIKEVFTKIT